MILPCAAPIPFGTFVEYWFGELAADVEQRVEEHFLGCDRCSALLETLSELHNGVRAAFERGAIAAIISPSLLETMKEHGMMVREYRVPPGGSVRCTIAATDDAVIGRLQAPLTGVGRVDLVISHDGTKLFRLDDVPFDPASGEVLICPAAAALKVMPAHTERVLLLAIEDDGEHVIADYTFIHAPA